MRAALLIAASGGLPENVDPPVVETAPVNTDVPTITGTVAVDSELLSSDGTWTGDPTPTFTFQWQHSTDGTTWTDITGEDSSGYTIVSGDEGDVLRCQVTATNDAGTATASTAATITVPTPTAGDLAIDSAPLMTQGVSGSANTTVVSGTFSPPAGSLIVLLVGDGADGNANTTGLTITDSLGTHLTWTKKAAAGSDSTGSCAIFTAPCPSAQTNMTVTATITLDNNGTFLPGVYVLPIVLTGAASTQDATPVTEAETSGIPSIAVTTTADDSIVLGVLMNGDSTATVTVGAGQTDSIGGHTQSLHDTVRTGSTCTVQTTTANTPTAGTTVTLDQTIGSDAWTAVAIEVLPA